MKSFTSRRFREMYASLPKDVRLYADRAYRLFRHNPSHPGLRFKMVDAESRMYSARVDLGYRALGLTEVMTSCGCGSARMQSTIKRCDGRQFAPTRNGKKAKWPRMHRDEHG